MNTGWYGQYDRHRELSTDEGDFVTDGRLPNARHRDTSISIEGALEDRYLRLLSSAYRNQQAASVRILRDQRGSKAIRHLARDAHARAHRSSNGALRISPPLQP